MARLVADLRPRELLLVVDNCEPVRADVAGLLVTLLDRCPRLVVLATSREPLRIPGEQVVPVEPLAVHERRGQTVCDAVRLFADRAAAVRHGFELTAGNEGDVLAVCRQVDGIPLAIELAAARTTHLSVTEIADLLARRLSVLASRDGTAAVRHRTLTATLDWSYDLLEPDERTLFRALAVYLGGVGIEAVEAVCTASGLAASQAVDLVSRLVDTCLLVPVPGAGGGRTRYGMLGTVRRYAVARLEEAGELDRARRHHAAWFAPRSAQDVDVLRPRPSWPAATPEHRDDLLAALDWAVDHDEAELAVALAAATWQYWEISGRQAEGRAVLDTVLRLQGPEPSPATARLVSAAASLAFTAGDYATAGRLHRANAEVLRGLGLRREAAGTHNSLAMVALFEGDVTAAEGLAREALASLLALGDPGGAAFARTSLGMVAAATGRPEDADRELLEALRLFRQADLKGDAAVVLSNLGNLAVDADELGRAHRFYEGALQLHDEVGDTRGVALSRNNLCIVTQRRGNLDRAWEHAEAARVAFRAVGDRPGEAATLNNLANLAGERGDYSRAVELYGGCIRAFRELGDARGTATSLQNLAELARRVGERRLAWGCQVEAASAWSLQGRSDLARRVLGDLEAVAGSWGVTPREALSPQRRPGEDDAAALARALEAARWAVVPEPSGSDGTVPVRELTPREAQVAGLVGRGFTNAGIAAELFISRADGGDPHRQRPREAGDRLAHEAHPLGHRTRARRRGPGGLIGLAAAGQRELGGPSHRVPTKVSTAKDAT